MSPSTPLPLVVVSVLVLAAFACTHARDRDDRAAAPGGSAVAVSSAPRNEGAPGAHGGYAAALAALERAERARKAAELETANRELDAGLRALGDDYAPRDVEDDTGLKLAAAAELWTSGRREDAISTKMNMLRTRLALYRQRYPSVPSGSGDPLRPAEAELLSRICSDAPCAGAMASIEIWRDARGEIGRLLYAGSLTRCSHPPFVYFDRDGKKTASIPSSPQDSSAAEGYDQTNNAQLAGLTKAGSASCGNLGRAAGRP